MYEIKLLNNKTNQTFKKIYSSFYLYQKALNKIRHSKKLTILSYGEHY